MAGNGAHRPGNDGRKDSPPTNVRLDDLDLKILWELRRDARITNAALADRLHVAPSTTHARVKALRDAGVIRSAHAELDYDALGLPVQSLVFVRLRPQARSGISTYAQRLALLPNVINVFFMGGQMDFVVHVACTSTAQLRDFVAVELSTDPQVASTETNIVFDHLVGADHLDSGEGLAAMWQSLGR